MNVKLLLRASLVAVGVGAILWGVLELVAGDWAGTPTRGIRIGVVSAEEAARARELRPIGAGAPNIHRIDETRFHSFERMEIPATGDGPAESVLYRALVLECRTARVHGPHRIEGDDVVLTLFPRPANAEEARRFAEEAPNPAARIRAGRAIAENLAADPAAPAPAAAAVSLDRGVEVVSTGPDRSGTLRADALFLLPAERRVRTNGPIALDSAGFSVRGTGFSGDAALGAFSIERDVRIEFPSATVFPAGPDKAPPDGTVVVSCGGPLFVERTGPDDDDGYTPVRIRFDGGVQAELRSDDPPGTPPALVAKRLRLDLRLLAGRPAKPMKPPVLLTALVAEGAVRFTREKEIDVKAERVEVRRTDAGDHVVMTGPAEARLAGGLAFPGGGLSSGGGKPALLVVTAGERIELDLGAAGQAATLSGDAVVEQRDEADRVLLRLAAGRIDLVASEQKGTAIEAAGTASFETPEATGAADRIEYTRPPEPAPDAAEPPPPAVARLLGSPELRIGKRRGAGVPWTGFHLRAEKSIELVERRVRTDEGWKILRAADVEGPAVVTRHLAGLQAFRVEAARLEAELEDTKLVRLAAEGRIDGRGTLPELGSGEATARGERLEYDVRNRTAVLEGAPGILTFGGEGPERSVFSAGKFTVPLDGDPVVLAGDVVADLALPPAEGAEKPAEPLAPRRVRLTCGRLALTPIAGFGAKAAETEKAERTDGLAAALARIAKVVATEAVRIESGEFRIAGDELSWHAGDGRIELAGAPASARRKVVIHGREFEDRFEAVSFTIRTADGEFSSFDAPEGGSFVFHRAHEGGGNPLLGGAGDEEKKQDAPPPPPRVERLTAEGGGRIAVDAKAGTARIEGGVKFRQEVGPPDGEFAATGDFRADTLEATFATDAAGAPVLTRVEGRGRVEGTGATWALAADSFVLDAKKESIEVRGFPARLTLEGKKSEVLQAVYHYGADRWEILGARTGGR